MSSIPITLINFQKVKSHCLLDSLTFDNWQGPLWAVRYIAYSQNCAIPKYVCSATKVWNTFHLLCLRRAAPLHFKHTIKFSSRTLWFDPHIKFVIRERALGGSRRGVKRSWREALIMPPASHPTELLTRKSVILQDRSSLPSFVGNQDYLPIGRTFGLRTSDQRGGWGSFTSVHEKIFRNRFVRQDGELGGGARVRTSGGPCSAIEEGEKRKSCENVKFYKSQPSWDKTFMKKSIIVMRRNNIWKF